MALPPPRPSDREQYRKFCEEHLHAHGRSGYISSKASHLLRKAVQGYCANITAALTFSAERGRSLTDSSPVGSTRATSPVFNA